MQAFYVIELLCFDKEEEVNTVWWVNCNGGQEVQISVGQPLLYSICCSFSAVKYIHEYRKHKCSTVCSVMCPDNIKTDTKHPNDSKLVEMFLIKQSLFWVANCSLTDRKSQGKKKMSTEALNLYKHPILSHSQTMLFHKFPVWLCHMAINIGNGKKQPFVCSFTFCSVLSLSAEQQTKEVSCTVMKVHFLLGKTSHAHLYQGLGTHPHCTKLFTGEGWENAKMHFSGMSATMTAKGRVTFVPCSRKTAAWCAQ